MSVCPLQTTACFRTGHYSRQKRFACSIRVRSVCTLVRSLRPYKFVFGDAIVTLARDPKYLTPRYVEHSILIPAPIRFNTTTSDVASGYLTSTRIPDDGTSNITNENQSVSSFVFTNCTTISSTLLDRRIFAYAYSGVS